MVEPFDRMIMTSSRRGEIKMADKTRKPDDSGQKPRESPEELRARIDATLRRAHAEANPPGRASPSFVVRFPDDGMRERLAHIAKKNGRSANSEIIDRLQRSMIGDQIANLEEMATWQNERIEKLENTVKDLAEQLRHRK
jgi:hypothetical protein